MGGWSRENKIALGVATILPVVLLLLACTLPAFTPTPPEPTASGPIFLDHAILWHPILTFGAIGLGALLQFLYIWLAWTVPTRSDDRALWMLAVYWGSTLGQLAFFALRIWPLADEPTERPLLY